MDNVITRRVAVVENADCTALLSFNPSLLLDGRRIAMDDEQMYSFLFLTPTMQ